MDNKKALLFVLLIILLVGVAWLFLREEPVTQNDNEGLEPLAGNEQIQQNVPVQEEEVVVESEVRMITVDAGNYYFSPDVIEVEQGETVEIAISSLEGMHDLSIPDLDVKTDFVQEGEVSSFIYTFDVEAGDYEFICTLQDHAEQGMIGVIRVQ